MLSRDELATVVVADAPGTHGGKARVYTTHPSTREGLLRAIESWHELRPGVSLYVAPTSTRSGDVVPASRLSQQSPDELRAWASEAPGAGEVTHG